MFLKNIRVDFVSLVRKGANKKTIIWKSGEGEPPRKWDVPLSKVDEEKNLVYGIVYSPGEVDSQGDHTDEKQIEKAAHLFLKGSKTGDGVDRDHSFQAEDGVYVAESWIVRKGDPVFPDDPEGSWAVAIKVEDDDLWGAVKKGDIGGLSMGGIADYVEKGDKSDTTVLSMIKRLIGKGDDMDEKQVRKIAKEAVEEAIKDNGKPLTKKDTVGIVTEAVKGVFAQIDERIKKLEKQTDGSSQDGDGDIGDGDIDYAALGASIAKSVTEG